MHRMIARSVLLWTFLTPSAPAFVIQGKVVEQDEYPATVWINNCTATVVGERVLLTASHCVGNPQVSFKIGEEKYTASCAVAREHQYNFSADYALCEIDRPVENISYERVVTDGRSLAVGDSFWINGYGCTSAAGRNKPLDGKLRVGESKITNLPAGYNYHLRGRSTTPLCSGDSGGPAFWMGANGDRAVVGVNSTSDFIEYSQVSATYVQPAKRFFGAWYAAKKHPICGIHAEAKNCRTPEVQESR